MIVQHGFRFYRVTGNLDLYPRVDRVVSRGKPPRTMFRPVAARSIEFRTAIDIARGRQ